MPVLAHTQSWLEARIPLVVEDRALDHELTRLVDVLRTGAARDVLESDG